jgi:chemotaxis response regulator CheB
MTPTNLEALPNLVAIGVSADGIGAIHSILGSLPKDFPAAVLLVMHRAPPPPARSSRFSAVARVCR